MSFQLNIKVPNEQATLLFLVFKTPRFVIFLYYWQQITTSDEGLEAAGGEIPVALIKRSQLQECEECGWALAVSRLVWQRTQLGSRAGRSKVKGQVVCLELGFVLEAEDTCRNTRYRAACGAFRMPECHLSRAA